MQRIEGEDLPELVRRHRGAWGQGTFLRRLRQSELSALTAAGTVVAFGPGEPIVTEGEAGTDVFLLLSSTVKVTSRAGEGRRRLLAVRAGGDVIGELAALEGQPRAATVEVRGREPAYAVRLDGPRFLQLMRELPDALLVLAASVARKLGAATRRRSGSGCSAAVRLAGAVADMAEDYGRRTSPRRTDVAIGVDLTQAEWGALIGVSESTAYRALQVLKSHRLVSVEYRRTVVRHLPELRAFAQA
ncbi:Crp/Fnr family transcriptional regulator [Streptomyces sp. NPDC096012]|uniref:Crp/Fnr family transcriptional regulator n=1 Tax=Streptomyces sp. NPDC096012 TaxID=3155684 RepID=UPI00336ABDC4